MHFLKDVCHENFGTDSLKISCTPTNGSALVGEYCCFALADVINTSIHDALFLVTISPVKYLVEKIVEQLSLILKITLAVVISIIIYNSTLFFAHLYDVGFVTLDEYNAVHDLNTPGHNPWIWCDIEPPKRCSPPFKP